MAKKTIVDLFDISLIAYNKACQVFGKRP